jgi:TonB family protein
MLDPRLTSTPRIALTLIHLSACLAVVVLIGCNRLDQSKKAQKLKTGLLPVEQTGKWGYMDTTGRFAISPKFDGAMWFSEGLAAVKVGDKWGCIDRHGAFVLDPQFDEALEFHEGLAVVTIGDKRRIIDRTGRVAIDSLLGFAAGFTEGLARVKVGDKWGFMNTAGKLVIAPQFDDVEDFSEGLAFVRVDGKHEHGYIDKTGQVVIEPQYKFGRSSDLRFSEGLATASVGDSVGFIDKTGRFVIAPRFDGASSFSEGVAPVRIFEKGVSYGPVGFIDRTGTFVIPPRFSWASSFSEGLAAVSEGEKVGFINRAGRFVIRQQFDWCGNFSEGLSAVCIGDRTGYINRTGKLVWRCGPPKRWDDFDDDTNEPTPSPDTETTEPPDGVSTQDDSAIPIWKADVKPQPVNVPDPVYPESARNAGIEGHAVVKALVDTNGSVADARIERSSGTASLDQAAVDAALRTTFTPASRKGRHVRVWVFIPFRFTLN